MMILIYIRSAEKYMHGWSNQSLTFHRLNQSPMALITNPWIQVRIIKPPRRSVFSRVYIRKQSCGRQFLASTHTASLNTRMARRYHGRKLLCVHGNDGHSNESGNCCMPKTDRELEFAEIVTIFSADRAIISTLNLHSSMASEQSRSGS